MTFNIAPRESISRCDTYTNKFQTYTSDIESRMKVARSERAIDIHESESARIERAMMQKFSKGFFRQEGANFEFVKKVGKFIFVAVLTPPYFAVYLAPKWVYQYTMPFVAGGLTRIVNTVGAAFNWVAQISGQLLAQFNQLFQFKLRFPHKLAKSTRDLFHRLLTKIGDEANKKKKRLQELWEAVKKKMPRITLPKINLRLPTFTLPTFTLPTFTLPSLKSLAFLKKIPIGLALFFWDILKVNYQRWIEPYIQWVVPFIRWLAKQLNTQLAKAQALYSRLQPLAQKLKFEIKLPKISLPKLPTLPKLPKITLPRFTLPSITLPTFTFDFSALRKLTTLPTRLLQPIAKALKVLGAFFSELGQAFRLAYIVLKVLAKLTYQRFWS